MTSKNYLVKLTVHFVPIIIVFAIPLQNLQAQLPEIIPPLNVSPQQISTVNINL